MSELIPSPVPLPAPGWYFDGTSRQRWWDGLAWGVYAPEPAPQTPTLVRTAKDTGTTYLLAILLGGFGAHHFYLGRAWSGVAFLALWWVGWLTTGLVIGFVFLAVASIWWIVDLFNIPSYVRCANERLQWG
jgi:TM2 domain-containing membrane protein YozV